MSNVKRKAVIVGDGNCGKTSLLTVLCNGKFPDKYVPTIHDMFTKVITVNNTQVELILYDTAGQEDYDGLRPLIYTDTDVFLLCFSIGSPNSFMNAQSKWIKELKYFKPNVPILLVGTKADLRNDKVTIDALAVKNQKPIAQPDVRKFIKDFGVYRYVECSARKNQGVLEVFENAALITLGNITKKRFKCVIL